MAFNNFSSQNQAASFEFANQEQLSTFLISIEKVSWSLQQIRRGKKRSRQKD